MGDAPPTSSPPNVYPSQETPGAPFQGHPVGDAQINYSQGPSPVGIVPFQSQYHPHFESSHNVYPSQFEMAAHSSGRPAPSFNMSAMASALPQTHYRPNFNNGGQQRYATGTPNVSMAQPMSPMGVYGPSGVNPQQYYLPPQHHMQAYYSNQLPSPQQQGAMASRPSMGFYSGQIVMNHAPQPMPGYYYPSTSPYPGPAATGSSQMIPGHYAVADSNIQSPSRPHEQDTSGPNGSIVSDANRSNVVRGPPRKPRQSGHAIWIGNLPPQTDLMNLVHHVCKEAKGLESLFLISKSNCAFANFKDEESCVEAQQKLHDSKFQSVRLVSRLRKSTVEGAAGKTAPTGPAATSPTGQPVPPDITTGPAESTLTANGGIEGLSTSSESQPDVPILSSTDSPSHRDKFFILKSLTVEDLELSVRNGVWATQSHNEETLNAAFQAADSVYLVFSANKSGEYFGYAKMTSPINNDPAVAIEFAPKVQTTSDMDLPKAIPTEATEHCPRGNIIDDSARGTIFWEIEREDGDDTASEDSASGTGMQDGESGAKVWGKPFKLEWLSTARLPFYRTRGLRNPWNSNREVKIARDGTELEGSVGRKLIGLFNRVQSPPPGALGMHQGMVMAAGYPPPPRQAYAAVMP